MARGSKGEGKTVGTEREEAKLIYLILGELFQAAGKDLQLAFLMSTFHDSYGICHIRLAAYVTMR